MNHINTLVFTAAFLSAIQVAYAQCLNSPDIVIVNTQIITMDPSQPFATAMAIREGIIQAAGNFEDIVELIPEGCPVKWIDAKGYTVLPGFNDAHSHWLSWREHICDAPGQEETTYPELDVIMDSISMHGWTSISELNFGRPALIPEHLENAMALEANGDLHVRINGYWGTYDNLDLLEELQDYGYGPGHEFSDRIRVPGVKMYVDDPFGTMDIMDQATCTQLVTAAHNAGYQVAAHCVNQTAVGKILNAYESALGASSNESIRHRIEHAVKVSDAQLDRIEDKSILLSFQLLGPPDWPEQNTFQTYLSNTNTDYLLRWKDFVDGNAPVVGSTDAPFNNSVCQYSPFRAIYQAVTRKGYIDRTHAQWELDQRITIEEGLKLLTIDGAWATGEENIKGSLIPGKFADLTIITEDPLSVQTPEDLLNIRSLLTMVGGETEYCHDNFPALCDPPTAFRVDSMIVIVSRYLNQNPPENAFDLNEETAWVSGSHAPQFISIDFLKNTLFERAEFVVDQFPSGFTRHHLLAAKENDDLALLLEFAGPTESGEVLVYNFTEPNNNFSRFHISTIESPSWVAWKEIRFLKAGATSTSNANDDRISMQLYPNPVQTDIFIALSLSKSIQNAEITILSADGKYATRKYLGGLSSGEHLIRVETEKGLGKGLYILCLHSGSMTLVSRGMLH